jgi:CelD/BcsL family acetyltransferase involved in cellulose biosynthesis
VLPATFEDFVASRSPNTRWRIRREARRLEEELGDDLAVEIVRDESGLDQLVRDADLVASRTYQRALGAGFSDTPEQRALAQVGLEHGWLRGYLLYLRGEPIAYWLCSVYRETMLIRTAGYDNAYAEHRVGVHLLMSVIEDAIADPALRILDFGPGDAAYKQQFSSDSRLERNAVVYAPTFRAVRINAVRASILGSARLVRTTLDAARLTDRVRASWRERLRQ